MQDQVLSGLDLLLHRLGRLLELLRREKRLGGVPRSAHAPRTHPAEGPQEVARRCPTQTQTHVLPTDGGKALCGVLSTVQAVRLNLVLGRLQTHRQLLELGVLQRGGRGGNAERSVARRWRGGGLPVPSAARIEAALQSDRTEIFMSLTGCNSGGCPLNRFSTSSSICGKGRGEGSCQSSKWWRCALARGTAAPQAAYHQRCLMPSWRPPSSHPSDGALRVGGAEILDEVQPH